jgi:hypothetical protein
VKRGRIEIGAIGPNQLFMPQGFDWVEACGAGGGVDAEKTNQPIDEGSRHATADSVT